MFPISLRSITGAFGAATQWLSSFAATMSAPHMQAAVGGYVFVFYGICCFATFVFTFFFIPETKGIPMESMGRLFGKSQCGQVGWREANRGRGGGLRGSRRVDRRRRTKAGERCERGTADTQADRPSTPSSGRRRSGRPTVSRPRRPRTRPATPAAPMWARRRTSTTSRGRSGTPQACKILAKRQGKDCGWSVERLVRRSGL